MPIEILPENYPDWIQFDSTDDIGFLAEDPFWQTKAGSADPEQAILYRGGEGFLDISSDGGKTWGPISLPDIIPWFEKDQQGHYDADLYEPIPQPDPSIQKPRPNNVTYRAYAGNPAHSGEHAVLCTYKVADGVDTGTDLDAMWIVYTYDDWAIVRWSQILNEMELVYAPLTEGTYVEWHNQNNAWYNDGPVGVKLGTANKFAAFHYYTTFTGPVDYIRASKLSASGTTLTVDGSVDQATSYMNMYPYVWGDKVYFGRITTHTDGGGKERARASVDEWDFSAATPVFNGTTHSDDIPDGFDVVGIDINGRTFMLTDGGRLAFNVSIRDTSSPTIRKTYLMYYDVVLDTFSTPYLYKSGTDGQGSPWGIEFSGVSTAGGDDAIVFEYYELTVDMHYLSVYFMNVGGWYNYDSEALFHGYHATWHYNVLERCCVKISNNRVAFNARNYGTGILKYNPSYLTIDEVYERPSGDQGLSLYQARAVRDDSPFLNNKAFFADLDTNNHEVIAYSDYDLFPHKMERWSDYLNNDASVGAVYCGYGDATNYIRIYRFSLGGSQQSFRAVAVTLGTKKASDLIYPRLFLGEMGWGTDGEILYIPTVDMNTDLTTFDSYNDEMYRDADGAAGIIDYETAARTGWRKDSWDTGISEADANARVPTINFRPYPAETDGIIVWGLLLPNSVPADPKQIYIWSTATGWDYVGFGSGNTDPVRAISYYGDKIYAAVYTSTGIELWGSSSPPWGGGNDMSHLSDCPMDDCGYSAMDHDVRDGTMVLANRVADLLMVFASPPPYTIWYNFTLSHRNDRGVTGLVVL